MRKAILIIFVFFVSILLLSAELFALNKKPKLNLPRAKSAFSANIPSSYTQGAVRGSGESDELKEMLENMSNQTYLTPSLAKIFQANPLFEWEQPLCNDSSPCKVSIRDKLTAASILEVNDIKQNSFLLDYEKLPLEPGKLYLFLVQNTEPSSTLSASLDFHIRHGLFSETSSKLDVSLDFYILSNDEKSGLISKLNSLNSNKSDDDYENAINELNFYVDEGLWFDLIEKLNQMLSKYPGDNDLIEFKTKIYQ